MPLPPALVERLKRRGIIKDAGEKPVEKQRKPIGDTLHERYGHREPPQVNAAAVEEQGEEEILAADYSDDNNSENEDDEVQGQVEGESNLGRSSRDHTPESDEGAREGHDASSDHPCHEEEEFESVMGCPNKYNIYHTCGRYCREHYESNINLEPTKDQRKQLALLLRTFPLPSEWKVVYDPGVCTFYFWNVITNQVSWYPPGMGALPCPSAECIRAMIRLERERERLLTDQAIT